MKISDVKEYLEFRKRFSKGEWFELNEAIKKQEDRRAAQVVLDDSDIHSIILRLSSCNALELSTEEKLEYFEKVGSDLKIFDQE